MRSRTLADERTRNFYTKLKRPYLFSWYLKSLGSRSDHWHRLSSEQKQGEFKINQIAFFKKHFWYHFNKWSVSGWIPVKHFRKNYCRLKLPINDSNNINLLNADSELACVITLCRYVKPNINVNWLINRYRNQRPKTIHDLFMVIASQLGRFQNISHKSMRRIRNQIRHQRPVVMKIKLVKHPAYIIIAGFNRRLFQYAAPLNSQLHLITRKRLLKAWRKCDYWAFSC